MYVRQRTLQFDASFHAHHSAERPPRIRPRDAPRSLGQRLRTSLLFERCVEFYPTSSLFSSR
jgi:hypothetical protein